MVSPVLDVPIQPRFDQGDDRVEVLADALRVTTSHPPGIPPHESSHDALGELTLFAETPDVPPRYLGTARVIT
jgi:hypothetical protein